MLLLSTHIVANLRIEDKHLPRLENKIIEIQKVYLRTALEYNEKTVVAIFLTLSVIFPSVSFDGDKEVEGRPLMPIVMASSNLIA